LRDQRFLLIEAICFLHNPLVHLLTNVIAAIPLVFGGAIPLVFGGAIPLVFGGKERSMRLNQSAFTKNLWRTFLSIT
jgi:hypothetical protein